MILRKFGHVPNNKFSYDYCWESYCQKFLTFPILLSPKNLNFVRKMLEMFVNLAIMS